MATTLHPTQGCPWTAMDRPQAWGRGTPTYSPSFSSCVYTSETSSWLLMTTSQHSKVSAPAEKDGAGWSLHGSLVLWGPTACTPPPGLLSAAHPLQPGATAVPTRCRQDLGGTWRQGPLPEELLEQPRTLQTRGWGKSCF